MEITIDSRDDVLVAADTMARIEGMSLEDAIEVVMNAVNELSIVIRDAWEESSEAIKALAAAFEKYEEIAAIDEPSEPWRLVRAIKPTKNHREARRLWRRRL